MAIDNGKIVAVGTADSLKTQYPMPPYAILTHADAGFVNRMLIWIHYFLGDDTNFIQWLVSMLKYQRTAQIAQHSGHSTWHEASDWSGTTCIGDFASARRRSIGQEMGVRTVIFRRLRAGGSGARSV